VVRGAQRGGVDVGQDQTAARGARVDDPAQRRVDRVDREVAEHAFPHDACPDRALKPGGVERAREGVVLEVDGNVVDLGRGSPKRSLERRPFGRLRRRVVDLERLHGSGLGQPVGAGVVAGPQNDELSAPPDQGLANRIVDRAGADDAGWSGAGPAPVDVPRNEPSEHRKSRRDRREPQPPIQERNRQGIVEQP
jgi:hypothetical protein